MWTFFLFLAVLGVIILMIYLLTQLNEMEKKMIDLSEEIRKHYEQK
jgi:cell division protein FtsL